MGLLDVPRADLVDGIELSESLLELSTSSPDDDGCPSSSTLPADRFDWQRTRAALSALKLAPSSSMELSRSTLDEPSCSWDPLSCKKEYGGGLAGQTGRRIVLPLPCR